MIGKNTEICNFRERRVQLAACLEKLILSLNVFGEDRKRCRLVSAGRQNGETSRRHGNIRFDRRQPLSQPGPSRIEHRQIYEVSWPASPLLSTLQHLSTRVLLFYQFQ